MSTGNTLLFAGATSFVAGLVCFSIAISHHFSAGRLLREGFNRIFFQDDVWHTNNQAAIRKHQDASSNWLSRALYVAATVGILILVVLLPFIKN